MSRHRILVVEDNQENMTFIVDVLHSLDYDVLEAMDGETGIQMAMQEHPDLILMDLSLPLKDGWTATREIKANASLCMIPVIALTAHAMKGDKERALAVGCDDYISKPINLQELSGKLGDYIG